MDKNETTDLAKSEPGELQVAPASPLMGIIAAASTDGNVDADKLMKLLEANERYEINEARKAYHVAMAAFKADPPKITKDRHVSYATKTGTTEYDHASLANVTDTISAVLSSHGLTSTWVTDQTEKGAVEVMCKITHVLGHSESCKLQSAPDSSGGKNAIQAVGSAVTYLQRYTLLALTGLATYENENDGNGAGNGTKDPPEPTAEEQEALDALCFALEAEAPDGLTIDPERIKTVCYAHQNRYPYDLSRTSKVAAWLVGILNQEDSWKSVCQKP